MTTPWYKQFWPWFIIALPLSAVIGGITTVIIAMNNSVDLVADDYYKQGKSINLDLARQKAAEQKKIKGKLSKLDDNLLLTLNASEKTINESLYITFAHPTLAGLDLRQMVNSDASGAYHIELPPGPAAKNTHNNSATNVNQRSIYRDKTTGQLKIKWSFIIEPVVGDWRIKQSLALPLTAPVIITTNTRNMTP